MYGAENDFELDVILDAIDRALDDEPSDVSVGVDACTKTPTGRKPRRGPPCSAGGTRNPTIRRYPTAYTLRSV